ncbi:hypothetical protein SprV_0602204100 [Sparganum proliferum]
MGSPLGSLLANVFMGKLEGFQQSDQIEELKHYGRNVDIFAIATTETDVSALLNAVNRAHPSIKVTLEMESAGSLPFLDVLLNRGPDGSNRKSVYRRKTWSEQYMDFASFVPLQQRARKICSTDSIEEGLGKIQDLLRENGYTNRFIAKNMAERPAKPTTLTAKKKTLSLKVPFQGDAASELLRRRLDQAVSRTFPILRGEGKDKLPPQTTSMCIYSFTCSCERKETITSVPHVVSGYDVTHFSFGTRNEMEVTKQSDPPSPGRSSVPVQQSGPSVSANILPAIRYLTSLTSGISSLKAAYTDTAYAFAVEVQLNNRTTGFLYPFYQLGSLPPAAATHSADNTIVDAFLISSK